MPPARTLPALLQLARRGDRAAFGALLDVERARLRRFVRRSLGGAAASPTEVEDIVQLTAVKAYRAIDGLRGKSRRAWRVWLRRIATNAIQDHLRSLGREGALRGTLQRATAHRPPDGVDVPSRRNGSEQALYTLRHLAFEERLVVSLQVYHDLAWDTTCQLLHRPSGRAARGYYERVRGRLRAGLRHLGLA